MTDTVDLKALCAAELNKRVALALGWKVGTLKRTGERIVWRYPFPPPRFLVFDRAERMPDFATKIEEAMIIVEYLKSGNPIIAFGPGTVGFSFYDKKDRLFKATSKTAALAICLAFLKSKGKEKSQ